MNTVHDEAYWASYYFSGDAPEEPSLFASYVNQNFLKPGLRLIEFGCGNGRDARFFANNGIEVLAMDLCAPEINKLIQDNSLSNLVYKAGDFTSLPDDKNVFDIVYSRFTLHSVTVEGQERALDWSYENLREGGRLCIETRGQRNELYKKGEPVDGEEDAFIYEGHYRRFVQFDKFITDIMSRNFKIIEATEDIGFSPYQDTDYHFIRVIAEK